MKKALWAAMGVLVLAGIVALGAGYLAPVEGTFIGRSGAWTNTMDYGTTLSAVAVVADDGYAFGSGTNSYIYLRSGSTTLILASGGVTNTLAYVSGGAGFMVPRNGVVSFFVASGTGTQTNRYIVLRHDPSDR